MNRLNILINVLGIKSVYARLIPKSLNLLQNRRRVEVANEVLDNVAENPIFIKRIIKNMTSESSNNIADGAQKWAETEKPKRDEGTQPRLISVWKIGIKFVMLVSCTKEPIMKARIKICDKIHEHYIFFLSVMVKINN